MAGPARAPICGASHHATCLPTLDLTCMSPPQRGAPSEDPRLILVFSAHHMLSLPSAVSWCGTPVLSRGYFLAHGGPPGCREACSARQSASCQEDYPRSMRLGSTRVQQKCSSSKDLTGTSGKLLISPQPGYPTCLIPIGTTHLLRFSWDSVRACTSEALN